MPRKRYSPEEIIHKLREAEVLLSQDHTVQEATRQLGIAEQTYDRWRKEYGGMDKSQARRLKDLERENTRLIPNVVITSSEEERDIVESYQLGINSYIVKERKNWKRGYYVRQQSFSGRTRNGWAILVGIVVIILLLSGCTGETPRVYRVGVLVGADTMSDVVDVFKARMTELGYVEGENIVYDVQSSNADPAEEERIADKFVTDQVDLVFVFPGQPALTVKAALQGTNIPIVFANAIIEGTDLVDSVRSPGGNITGVRFPGSDIALKSFESLLEFTPRFERIMVIYDPNYPTTPPALEVLRSVALSSNVTLQEVHVTRLQDTQAVLQGLEESGDDNMDAILLLPDLIPRSSEATASIFKFADEHRVPVAGGPDTLVRNGGAILSATADAVETGELAASLADKILKGTPAGTIPVVSPQPQLYINYTKTQELGLTVPEGLLKQAVEIIH